MRSSPATGRQSVRASECGLALLAIAAGSSVYGQMGNIAAFHRPCPVPLATATDDPSLARHWPAMVAPWVRALPPVTLCPSGKVSQGAGASAILLPYSPSVAAQPGGRI